MLTVETTQKLKIEGEDLRNLGHILLFARKYVDTESPGRLPGYTADRLQEIKDTIDKIKDAVQFDVE